MNEPVAFINVLSHKITGTGSLLSATPRTLSRCSQNLFTLVLVVLLTVLPSVSFAQKENHKPFEHLKARYKTLINREPSEATKGDWFSLIEELTRYAKIYQRDHYELAARAAFEAVVLEEQLGYSSLPEAEKYATSFEDSFQEVSRAFPRSQIADDALLRAALAMRKRGASTQAEALETKILEEFATSDSALAVRMKSGQTGHEARDGKTNGEEDLVIIDPGHGGEDFGAEGAGGILEKDIVLLVALELKQKLAQRGIASISTRSGDRFIPLADRVALSNDKGASVFVSLHCNASERGDSRGFEIYYLGPSDDRASARVAALENRLAKDAALTNESDTIIGDMYGQIKEKESRALAEALTKAATTHLKATFPSFRARPPKKAPLYVLSNTLMPAVLVELLYIDENEEGALLLERENRAKYAEALALGIERFLKSER